MSRQTPLSHWYLERYAPSSGALERTVVEPVPFTIGRSSSQNLRLASPEVSGHHAEIVTAGDGIAVRDVGSTNGTFVNRAPLEGTRELEHGDVLHVADVELRVVRESESLITGDGGTIRLSEVDLPRRFSGFAAELRALLDAEAVQARLEPIARLADGNTVAAEALARGTSPDLPQSPVELFALAAEAGLAAELSRLCRTRAAALAREVLAPDHVLFLNTHPDEIDDPEALVASVALLRTQLGDRRLVLEIHETAVTEPAAILDLRRQLEPWHVGLAYDDFGAGQARLVELAEAPPDYLKLDRKLISGLDRETGGRRQVVTALVAMAADLEIPTVAEGVETDSELNACREAGFTLVQGHALGPYAPG